MVGAPRCRWRRTISLAYGKTFLSVEAFQAFQFIFYSELLFFESRDPGFIPIGVGHFSGDDFFEFSMLIGQMVELYV
jgi:hypothetical protein